MTSLADWSLHVDEPGVEPREVELVHELSIGRHPKNAIALEDPKSSGRHARILVLGECVLIEDVGSSNKTIVEHGPTLLGGEMLGLRDGMRLLIGDTHVLVRGPATPDPVVAPAAAGDDVTATLLATLLDVPRPQETSAAEVQSAEHVEHAEHADELARATVGPEAAALTASPWLLAISGPGDDEAVLIAVADGTTLGRHPESSCRLSDPLAAGRQALLQQVGDDLLWEDLGAGQRTSVVDGPELQRGEQLALRAGMQLRLGDTQIEVRHDAENAAAAQAEPAAVVDPAALLAEREAKITASLADAKTRAQAWAAERSAGFAANAARAGWKLDVKPAQGAASEIALDGLPAESVLTIGRKPSCDVPLDDARVSGLHARIRDLGGDLVFEDLGSSNHSQIEDGPCLGTGEAVRLRPGLVILLGDARLEVRA